MNVDINVSCAECAAPFLSRDAQFAIGEIAALGAQRDMDTPSSVAEWVASYHESGHTLRVPGGES